MWKMLEESWEVKDESMWLESKGRYLGWKCGDKIKESSNSNKHVTDPQHGLFLAGTMVTWIVSPTM